MGKPVEDLEGAELALWVAKAEKIEEQQGIKLYESGDCLYKETAYGGGEPFPYRPDCNWTYGGPIVERLQLSIEPEWDVKCPGNWAGTTKSWRSCSPKNLGGLIRFSGYGKKPLVAAMRCYLSIVYGEEVPDVDQP